MGKRLGRCQLGATDCGKSTGQPCRVCPEEEEQGESCRSRVSVSLICRWGQNSDEDATILILVVVIVVVVAAFFASLQKARHTVSDRDAGPHRQQSSTGITSILIVRLHLHAMHETYLHHYRLPVRSARPIVLAVVGAHFSHSTLYPLGASLPSKPCFLHYSAETIRC